jgi:hypothetical protein
MNTTTNQEDIMTSIPEIRLHKHEHGWMAQFVGDQKIMEAFGADTIPTAFTAQANPLTVLREIQRLNPSHLVTLPA